MRLKRFFTITAILLTIVSSAKPIIDLANSTKNNGIVIVNKVDKSITEIFSLSNSDNGNHTSFGNISGCSQPSNQSASAEITTADIDWQENGSAISWDIEWGPVNFTQGSGTMITGTSSKPYNLTGLSINTSYDWYVRADCGDGIYSAWTGPHNFSTTDGKATNPNPANFTFGVASSSTTLDWDDVPGADSYIINVGTTSGGDDLASNVACPTSSYTHGENWPIGMIIYWQVTTVYDGGSTVTGDTWLFFVACETRTPTYSEDFAVYKPACWTEKTGRLTVNTNFTGTYSDWEQYWFAFNNENTKSAKLRIRNTDTDEWLISPSIDLSGGSYQLEFDIALTSIYNSDPASLSSDDSVAVVISTDNGTTWSVNNILRVWTAATSISNIGEHIIIDLSAYNTSCKIGFYGASTVTNDESIVFIDNFIIQTPPTCPAPQILTHDNETPTGSDLSWTDASGSYWDIYIVPHDDAAPDASTTPTANDQLSTTYTWTGGSGHTTYDWYVRTDCGQDNSDVSAWTGPNSFTTLAGVQAIPFTEDWESNTIGDAWDEMEGSHANLNTSTASAYSGTYGLHQYSYYYSYTIPTGLAQAYTFAVPGGANENNTSWVRMSVDLSTATYPYLSFWYDMGYYMGVNYNNFWVQASTDLVNWTDVFATQSTATHEFKEVEINMSAYSGNSMVYIRFFHNGNYSNNYLYIDDILIEDVSCPKPTDMQATTAPYSASLDWTENAVATTWDIEWGPEGFTQGEGTIVSGITSKPYSLTNLNAITRYDWYVRADCGGGDASEWVGPDTFKTDCGIVNAIFADYFDDAELQDLPDCWSSIKNTIASNAVVETTASYDPVSERFQIRMYNSYDPNANLYLITPQLGDLTSQQNQIRFYAKGTSSDYELIVGSIGDPTDESTFNGYDTITLTDTHTEYTIMFTFDYTESDEYIAFKLGPGDTYRTILIDNFVYEAAPTCPNPSGLTEDNIYDEGADLSWDENGQATNWDIMIGEEAFDTSGAAFYSQTAASITVDTLMANTSYDWYVRASCGGGDYSDWVGPNLFTTNCSAMTATVTEDFDGISSPDLPDCWSDIVNSTSGSAVVETYTYVSPHSSPNQVRLYNSSDASAEVLLISPAFSDLTDQTNQVRFYAKASTAMNLLVGTMSDPGDESTFTLFQTIALTTSNLEYEVEFGTSYTATDENVVFKLDQGNSGRAIYIDDFVYEPIPTCKTPVDQSVASITTTGATFSWTGVGSASNWDIYIVQMEGDAPDENTVPTVNDLTSESYIWTGGIAGTTYDWYVRSDCGGNNTDVSLWRGYNTFSTLITNDDCSGATELSVGYSENWKQATNEGATNSENNPDPIPDPGCASYQGSDVWFSVTVPSSGYLIVTSQSLDRSDFDDSGMGVYTGDCSSLVLYECDDDDADGNFMSKVVINDASMANSSIYIRFWSYDNDEVGPFEITAYTNPFTATWTGSTNNDWDNADNWDFDGIPGGITDVTIPVGLSNYPTVSSYYECNDLTIKSDASGTASLIGAELLGINGVVTVERFITGGQWHGLASPVDGATLNAVYSNTYNVWVDEYSEITDSWTGITSLATPFPFGKGFNYWVQAGPRADLTIEFHGDLRTSSLTLDESTNPPIAFSDAAHGYNFVGNPFTSPIDWDEGSWDTTNISGVVWVWQTSSGANGNYVTRNAQGAGSLAGGIIPMAQGFFIKTTGASPSLTIPLNARVHSGQSYYKELKQSDLQYAIFKAVSGDSKDEVWVTFTDTDTDGLDLGHDAEKLFGSATSPQLYCKEGENNLSIDALGNLEDQEKIVALFFDAGQTGEQELTADLSGLKGVSVILEDLLLDTLQDLNIKPVYSFYSTYYQSPDRFRLHFQNNTSGIEDNRSDLLNIYASAKAININCSGHLAKTEKEVYIFDIMGRLILKTKAAPSMLTRIPVNQNNSFLIVKVISDGEMFTSTVFIK